MPTEQSPWQKDIRRIRSKIKALIIVNVIFLFCISAELTPFVCMYIDSYLPVYDRQLLPKTYIAAASLVYILIVCILILYLRSGSSSVK